MADPQSPFRFSQKQPFLCGAPPERFRCFRTRPPWGRPSPPAWPGPAPPEGPSPRRTARRPPAPQGLTASTGVEANSPPDEEAQQRADRPGDERAQDQACRDRRPAPVQRLQPHKNGRSAAGSRRRSAACRRTSSAGPHCCSCRRRSSAPPASSTRKKRTKAIP